MISQSLTLLCLLLPGFLIAQTGLGESLLLEGRMAMARAEQYLIAHQNRNGAWEDSLETTAQAILALANAGISEPEILPQAEIFLQKHGGAEAVTATDCILAARSRLRLGSTPSPAIQKTLRQLAEEDLSPDARQWLLEIHYLLKAEGITLLAETGVSQLQQQLQSPNIPPALRLFAALCPESVTPLPDKLAGWRQEARAAARDSDANAGLWLSRALKAYETRFPGEDDAWRANLSARLLETQHRDGSWGERDRPILETALALQALQHCLAGTGK